MSWAHFPSLNSTGLIWQSRVVQFSVTIRTDLSGLLNGRGRTFIFITGPHNGCIAPILTLHVSWGFTLCGLHSVVLHSQLGQSICLCWYSLHNTSTNHPAAFLIWSCKYCSVVIVVAHMCLVLCVISLPAFITQIVYELPHGHNQWVLLWLATVIGQDPASAFLSAIITTFIACTATWFTISLTPFVSAIFYLKYMSSPNLNWFCLPETFTPDTM